MDTLQLLAILRSFDCSGTIEDVFRRLDDSMLDGFVDAANRGDRAPYIILLARMEDGEIRTDLAGLTSLTDKLWVFICLELMRRRGEIEIRPGFPPTLHSEQGFATHVTEKGKQRHAELEAKLAKERNK